MEGSIVCGVLVGVQSQNVIGGDQVGRQVTVALGDVKLPLGCLLCLWPQTSDRSQCVIVTGPGVQLQEVGDEHGGDIRHDPAIANIHVLIKQQGAG